MGVGAALREPLTALMDALAPQRCAGCGAAGAALCGGCVEVVAELPVPLLGGVRAAFPYEDVVRRVVHRGKFRDCRSALRALAWIGAERLVPPSGAAVVAVPLAPARQVERGYNQAAVVADVFARFHRLTRRDPLQRVRETAPQSTLDRVARRANVAGAFVATEVRGQTVWLVDDVRTTGATTTAAARRCCSPGARSRRGRGARRGALGIRAARAMACEN